jgi:small-conductance mechanosensitive channel
MHPGNGQQLDLSAQVARVKVKARPWKSIIVLILAIALAIFSEWIRHDRTVIPDQSIRDAGAWASAAVFCVFGCVATYGLAGQVRKVLLVRYSESHAAVVRYFLLLFGAFVTLVITLELFSVPAGQLVLGGALTTVFLSIAAQQALGNVFAGIVLLLARPFRVGDTIRLRAGVIGGQLDGTVTDIGITYVRLNVGGTVMSVPNSQVLACVVGPVPAPPPPVAGESPAGVQPAPAAGAQPTVATAQPAPSPQSAAGGH